MKICKKLLVLLLVFSMLVPGISEQAKSKTVKPTLTSKISITVGAKKTIQIKKVSSKKIKKTTWKSSNKKVTLSSKKKNKVTIKAKTKGTVKVTAKITLKNKKKYTRTCKVTVKSKTVVKPVVTPVPTPAPTLVTPTSTPKPTAMPSELYKLPEAEAVAVPEKPADHGLTDEVSSDSSYNLTSALNAASVKDAYSKYFSIGAAINGTQYNNSTAASPEMRQVMKRHFNSTTLSNLMKPQYLLDEAASKANSANGKDDTPAVKFDTVVDNLEFCKASGIKMRGHVLVWHTQTPDWFFRKGFTTNGAYVDKVTMQKRMGSYIRQVLTFCQTYYPGVIYCWDVVNEAAETSQETGYRNSTWYRIMGEEFVADAFYYARKYAASDVKLFYNDYNAFDSEKCTQILKMVEPLKKAGLLDGVGMQSYLNHDWPDLSDVETAIRRYAAADLEIQLTELTYRVPDYTKVVEADYEEQGRNYQSLMERLIALDTASGGPANITNVTFFGLIDNPYSVFEINPKPDQDCWARLFDQNFMPKPAYTGVMNAIS